MAKNMHDKSFTKETLLKLDLFRECFKEWYPVFLHSPYYRELYVYDLFAGSGYDSEGNPGSPIIFLQEAMGENSKHCDHIKNRNNNKRIYFVFNEYEPKHKRQKKHELLDNNIKQYIANCKVSNNCSHCNFTTFQTNRNFDTSFKNNQNLIAILNDNKKAKFIFLDQYGFTHIDAEIFDMLVKAPHTDFIFFISSSFILRFKEHEVTKKFLGDKSISFDNTEPNRCHQVILEYFESLVPEGKEYYLNHFTIKKGSNYYGLIFGTAHTLGMEKFQKVCWQHDEFAGESNCNTQNDIGGLFAGIETPNKIQTVKYRLTKDVLSGDITNNSEGLKRALKYRCMPKIFTEVIKQLEKSNKIRRVGSKSNKATDIHRIKDGGNDYYTIEVL